MEKILSLTRHARTGSAPSPLSNLDADALLENLFTEPQPVDPAATQPARLEEPDFVFKVR